MKVRFGNKEDKKEFLRTQKEAFPNLDVKQQTKYFDEKIKNKEIFIAEENKEYLGHHCFGKHLLNPPFVGGVFGEELAVRKKFRGVGIGTKLVDELIKYSLPLLKEGGYLLAYKAKDIDDEINNAQELIEKNKLKLETFTKELNGVERKLVTIQP